MAASLTLSAVAVAPDGKTVTAAISGGTGAGYSIGGTTGLAPKLGIGQKEGFVVTSASVSGTILTLTAASTMGQGEAIQFDIATSATLTDSGSNTPTGQTDLAVTNNSTVPVTIVTPSANPELFELNGSFAGTGNLRNSDQWVSGDQGDSPWEFVADATEVSMLGYSATANAVRVDDAASATTAPVNGFWSIKPLASGLAAGKHLFRVTGDYFGGVRLAGGARALTTVATTKRTIEANTASYLGIPQATPITAWGARKPIAAGDGTASVANLYVGLTLDCAIVGSGLELATVSSPSSSWAVSIDGGQPGPLVVPGDVNNVAMLAALAKGLNSGPHTISATFVSVGVGSTQRAVKVINGTRTTASSSVGATTLTVASAATLAVGDWVKIDYYSKRECRQITAISGTTVTLNSALAQAHASGAAVTSYSAPTGTLNVWTHKDLSSKRLAAMGDSNTQGWNELGIAGTPDASGNYYSFYDPREPPTFRAADPLNIEVMNLGVQGQTSAQMAARVADFGTYAKGSFDFATIWPFTNDINGTTITPAQAQANAETIVAAAEPYLRSGGKIILMPPGTPNTTNAGGLNLATALTALQNVAAAHPATTVVATDLFTGMVSGDYNGVHYNLSGRQKVGANLQTYLDDAATVVASVAVLTGMFAAS